MDSRALVSALLAGGVWTSAGLMAAGLAAGRPDWLRAGLLVLLATPPLRVAALALVWARERDWRFAAAAAGVLALMLSGAALH